MEPAYSTGAGANAEVVKLVGEHDDPRDRRGTALSPKNIKACLDGSSRRSEGSDAGVVNG